uniref:RUN and TBC1 domain-containing protein 3 n=1 Tax=Macrostomum lignano TaxID=282301 RepID=A0A1I8FAM2_9PLAT
LSLITRHWFLTLFAGVLPVRILLRVWDQFLLRRLHSAVPDYGSRVEKFRKHGRDFQLLVLAPTRIGDIDCLLEALNSRICLPINQSTVTALRGRFTAALMADEGGIISIHSVPNLPKQKLNKRRLLVPLRHLLVAMGSESNGVGRPRSPEDQEKAKNVRQTELPVTLRDAIHQIGRHFKQHDAKHSNIVLQADYGLESHARTWSTMFRGRRRRVKALLDFERHDDDELGFRKNDIITVISMRDEHCWVGELNGPSRLFVELLDERSKDYSSAGDDSVNEGITDLVRGVFCPAFKEVFEHGLKRSHLLGGTAHPWLFVEEASAKEVEKDFNSVYSRLVLCKTFRLDEDGKAVQTVNLTHDAAHAQMDVKFRSLMCYGLNEQVLHLWLEGALQAAKIVVKKMVPLWSFLRSPGWVQIKCEL